MKYSKNNKIIIIFIIYLIANFNVYGQEFNAKNLKVEWSDSNKILITYDLSNPDDKTVNIKIFLMSNDDPLLKIEVKSAEGKIGVGKYSGSGNKVVWEIYRDYPELKEGESYYFTLDASILDKATGGWPWYYYLGGGVAAGAAVFLVAHKSSSGTNGTNGTKTSGFPLPPNRN
jgi:hypothetical protein